MAQGPVCKRVQVADHLRPNGTGRVIVNAVKRGEPDFQHPGLRRLASRVRRQLEGNPPDRMGVAQVHTCHVCRRVGARCKTLADDVNVKCASGVFNQPDITAHVHTPAGSLLGRRWHSHGPRNWAS